VSRGKKPSRMRWDPAAWLADEALTRLSTASRAIWFDLLNRMWMQRDQSGVISGTADQLARLARCTGSEIEGFLKEAEQHALCELSRDSNGIVTLKNSRLVDDENIRKQTALRVARHRQKTAKPSVTVSVSELQRRDAGDQRPDTSEQIEEKEEQNVPTNCADAAPEDEQQLRAVTQPEVKATTQAVGHDAEMKRLKTLTAGGSEDTDATPADNGRKLPESAQETMRANFNAAETYNAMLPKLSGSRQLGSVGEPAFLRDLGPCPKCGRRPTLSEGPMWINGILVSHQNCRPTRLGGSDSVQR
jgi:hypothetical protein